MKLQLSVILVTLSTILVPLTPSCAFSDPDWIEPKEVVRWGSKARGVKALGPLSSPIETLPIGAPACHGKNPCRVSSDFGLREDPETGTPKFHSGVDFAAARGTPVYAVADGVILLMGDSGPRGNRIVIAHQDSESEIKCGAQVGDYDPEAKYASAYSHLDSFSPKLSMCSRVKQGELIGYVGNTGTSTTGVHLHFEILKDSGSCTKTKSEGTYCDPRDFVELPERSKNVNLCCPMKERQSAGSVQPTTEYRRPAKGAAGRK